SSGTVPDPQDLEKNIQLSITGLPSTLDEGTRKSKPLPEGSVTYPKDLGGNIQPLDKDLTSTTSEEGSAKTTPRPEGSLRDKDSGGNITPADMEPIHTLVADPSGTVVKYQDELDKESDEEEVLVVGEDMDKDKHVAEEVRTPSPKQDQPEPSNVQDSASVLSSPDLKKFDNTLSLTERQLIKYLRKMSRVLFHRITKDNWENHEEASVNYANLKASIDDYYEENVPHRGQTDKLVEASMSSLDKSSTTINDLYKGLNVITELLKDIHNAIKDDPAANQKLNEATKTFAKISSNITEVPSLVKGFDFSALQSTVKDIQAHALKQDEELAAWAKSSTNMAWNLGFRISRLKRAQNHIKTNMSSLQEDTTSIKSMMTKMYDAVGYWKS
ncbi:hypothetical protein Tco_1122500, partial [Tanacetum coccineum]